jgi:RNA polymerase sigma-70 factor (ECF subfamily)
MDSSSSRTDLSALLAQSDWLHALARRLVGDPGAADDLVQETWVAALRNPPDVTRPARPWLAGVLRKLVLLRRRSEGRRARRDEAVAREEGLPSAAEMVESVDTGRRLAGLVLQLAEPYRTTVLLRYWHDLSSAEIARRQGIPEGTVRWRLKRGMDELREELDGAFGERRSWRHALVAMLSTRALTEQETLVSSGGGLASLAGVLVLAVAVAWAARELGAEHSKNDARELAVSPAESASAPASVNPAGVNRTDAVTTEREALVLPPARVARVVSVRDELGAPVGDAVVVIDDGTSAGATARTGPDGLAHFVDLAPRVATVEAHPIVYVCAAGAYLVWQELAPDEGTTLVSLPRGVEISGRLAVHGAAPGESVRLALALDHPVFDGPIPPAVETHFGTARRAIVSTGPDGSFCFRGLDPRWCGTLELPKTWRLAGAPAPEYGGPRLRFEHPERGLRIDLEPRPHLSGTVLTSGGTPADHALVALELGWHDGDSTLVRDRADDEGGFVLLLEEERLGREPPAHAVLTAKSSDGRLVGARDLERGEVVDGAVIAPLELEVAVDAGVTSAPPLAAKNFALLVTDEEGQPLVGATAELAAGAPRAKLSRSDAYGALALDLPEEGSLDLLLAHPGYVTRLVHADRGASDQPLVVVLERGHDLELELVDETGMRIEGLGIEARVGDVLPVWTAASLGGGRYRLTGLGAEPHELLISLGESRWSLRVDPLAERLRLTLGAPDEPVDK